MLRNLPVVYDRGEDVRDLLIAAISRTGTLRPEDFFEPSWSIVPQEAADAAKRAFDTARAIAASYDQTRPVDFVPTIFAIQRAPEPEPATPPPPPAPAVAEMKFPVLRSPGENSLGRLVADARRNAVRAHFAIVLNDNLAADLPAGDVTRDDIVAVLPHDMRLLRLTLTGEELHGVLEQLLAGDDLAAHVSGLEVWYDPRRDQGRRITRLIFPDGRDIVDNQAYTLAVSAPLVEGAGGLSTLAWLPLEVVDVSDVEALIVYLQRLRSPVEAPTAPRIHSTR